MAATCLLPLLAAIQGQGKQKLTHGSLRKLPTPHNFYPGTAKDDGRIWYAMSLIFGMLCLMSWGKEVIRVVASLTKSLF